MQSKQEGVASLLPLLLPEFLTGEDRLRAPALVAAFTDLILAASVKGLVGGALALETRPDFYLSFPDDQRAGALELRHRGFSNAYRTGRDAQSPDPQF
ncbi:MAG: hypothetical protein H0X34_00340 [Chthoniobacterales bacterium]|nr:hypothetical protein [Chthoniobacterales bacterium]